MTLLILLIIVLLLVYLGFDPAPPGPPRAEDDLHPRRPAPFRPTMHRDQHVAACRAPDYSVCSVLSPPHPRQRDALHEPLLGHDVDQQHRQQGDDRAGHQQAPGRAVLANEGS